MKDRDKLVKKAQDEATNKWNELHEKSGKNAYHIGTDGTTVGTVS
jgi:hypothetical protein